MINDYNSEERVYCFCRRRTAPTEIIIKHRGGDT